MISTKEFAMQWLKQDEGLELMPYLCSEKVQTIGYGRAIGLNGISVKEAEFLLENDFETARRDAITYITPDVFMRLNNKQQAVLVCMAFNLGLTRLQKFKLLKKAIIAGNFSEAKAQMLNSKWARQVKNRANRLADQML